MTNIIKNYYIKQILKIAKENNYKYALLWADKLFEKINKENDLISIELIKKEMSKYYQTIILKKAIN